MSTSGVRVILGDGYQVSEALLKQTQQKMKEASEVSPTALFDLVKKCEDPAYKILLKIHADSTATLKAKGLLQEDGTVDEDTRRIVLNSITRSAHNLVYTDPLRKRTLSVIENGPPSKL